MNIDQLRRLSPEDQREYIEVEKRYDSDTWRYFKAWAETQRSDALQRAAYADNWDVNRANMGAVMLLDLLLAQEDMDFQTFELKLQELEEDPDDVSDLQL